MAILEEKASELESVESEEGDDITGPGTSSLLASLEQAGISSAVQQMMSPGSLQDKKLLAAACKVLAGWAEQSEEKQLQIVEAGAVEAVLNAMSRHFRYVPLQSVACAALHNIAFSNPRAREHEVKHGAIPILAATLARHLPHADVVMNACDALATLACIPTVPEVIGEGSAVESAIAALDTHSHNADVIYHSLYFLTHLMFEHGCKAKARQLQLPDVAHSVLERFPDDRRLQVWARDLLTRC